MGVIICATGNGDASRHVQNAAVELARQQHKRLVFFHVIDVSRLGELEPGLVPAAERELAWLGQASLRLAQERAHRRGVHADIAIRRGRVRPALEQFMREQDTDLLMLGQPTDDALIQFASLIEADTGVPVQLVTANAGDNQGR
jgi:nucleotide-binding universal stress UspA family protein